MYLMVPTVGGSDDAVWTTRGGPARRVDGHWVSWAVWFLVGVVVGGPWVSEAYNFSPLHARVMHGPPQVQFGYSVALWSDNNGYKRAVVGAPRGKNSTWADGKLPLGNIFMCEVLGNVHCSADTRLPDVSDSDKSKEALKAGVTMKNYGMGFGHSLATLKQDTSALAACAPRYPRRESKSMESRGACFILRTREMDPIPVVVNPGRIPKKQTLQNAMVGFSVSLDDSGESVVMGGPTAFYGEGVLYNEPFNGGLGTINRLSDGTQQPDTEEYTSTYEGWAVVLGNFDNQTMTIAASTVKYGSYTGRVNFYPKKMVPQAPPLATLYGSEVGAQFGYSLGSGDVDGDGAADLLVGAPLALGHNLAPDAGKVFVYYAPLLHSRINGSPQVVNGSKAWGRLGAALTSLGDANLDGYDDVAVAAPYAGMEGSGIVYVYYGGPDGLRTTHIQMIKASFYSGGIKSFGFSLDGGLDLDDNGYTDLIIGAPESDTAVLIKSKPVIRLVGDVSFTKDVVTVEDSGCEIEAAGYRSFRGVCFYLRVNITYDTYKKFDNLRLRFTMLLEGPEDTSQYGFNINNDYRYTFDRSVNIAGKSSPWSLQAFFKRVRSNIGQTLRASVSVSLPPPDTVEGREGLGDDDHDDEVVEPVLDVFTRTTFTTNTTLVCNNNITCFSQPDLALAASASSVRLGEDWVEVELQVEVLQDPGYKVQVEVQHPEVLQYARVEGKELIPTCSHQQLVNQISNTLTCTFDFIEADEVVNFTLHFEYEAVPLLDYLIDSSFLTIPLSLAVSSDSDGDTNTDNNHVIVDVPVITKATLYPKEDSKPESTIVVVNQTASSEELKEAQVNPIESSFPVDRLGPHLQHTFSLTNRGPSPVRGAKLVFEVPLYRSNGDPLTYMMSQPVTSPSVTCELLPVNLFGLQPPIRRKPTNTTATDPAIITTDTATITTVTMDPYSTDGLLQQRRRRQAYPVDFTYTSPSTASEEPDSSPDSLILMDDLTRSLQCLTPACTFTCEVGLMEAGTSVNVSFSSYFVTSTVSQTLHKNVEVKTWMRVVVEQRHSIVLNAKTAATTHVSLIRPPKSGLSAVSPLILLLAVAVSMLIILFMMAGLWWAGFFKRNRPPTRS